MTSKDDLWDRLTAENCPKCGKFTLAYKEDDGFILVDCIQCGKQRTHPIEKFRDEREI